MVSYGCWSRDEGYLKGMPMEDMGEGGSVILSAINMDQTLPLTASYETLVALFQIE